MHNRSRRPGGTLTRVLLPAVAAMLLGPLPLLTACAPAREPADLVVRNGRIFTVDETLPEARALAARGDRIVFVGQESEVEPFIGPDTEVIDLDGGLAIPGFIEGHGHFMGIGEARLQLDLMDAGSYQELVDRVAAAVAEAEPGEWIVGRGWHQSKWDPPPEPMVRGFQTHDALSAVSPDNPVWLTHASGHAGFANAKAMEVAGVTAATPSPTGGEIIVDRRGRPTGIFVETAQRLIGRAYQEALERMGPEERAARRERAFRLAAEECLAKGITSFQDAGSSPDTIRFFREQAEGDYLGPRLWVMVRAPVEEMPEALPELRVVGFADNMLTVRAIKITADGALGSRGAWLLEPYADDPGNTGHNTYPLEDLRRVAALAMEHDYQLCVHAIGDRANREVLDVFEATFEEFPEEAEEARWRIEHAQHLHPDDIPRFAELGVIASMQAVHATSDGPWVPDRIGPERARTGAYVWRSLMDAGALVTNGTDAPVEDVDPIASFYASVTRRMASGETFFPEQAMTRQEALRSYTLDAAYAAFEEELKGSLTPGKLADITVLSRDILTVPEEEIPEARVLYTIVGGQVVHRLR